MEILFYCGFKHYLGALLQVCRYFRGNTVFAFKNYKKTKRSLLSHTEWERLPVRIKSSFCRAALLRNMAYPMSFFTKKEFLKECPAFSLRDKAGRYDWRLDFQKQKTMRKNFSKMPESAETRRAESVSGAGGFHHVQAYKNVERRMHRGKEIFKYMNNGRNERI